MTDFSFAAFIVKIKSLLSQLYTILLLQTVLVIINHSLVNDLPNSDFNALRIFGWHFPVIHLRIDSLQTCIRVNPSEVFWGEFVVYPLFLICDNILGDGVPFVYTRVSINSTQNPATRERWFQSMSEICVNASMDRLSWAGVVKKYKFPLKIANSNQSLCSDSSSFYQVMSTDHVIPVYIYPARIL